MTDYKNGDFGFSHAVTSESGLTGQTNIFGERAPGVPGLMMTSPADVSHLNQPFTNYSAGTGEHHLH